MFGLKCEWISNYNNYWIQSISTVLKQSISEVQSPTLCSKGKYNQNLAQGWVQEIIHFRIKHDKQMRMGQQRVAHLKIYSCWKATPAALPALPHRE